MCVLFSITRGCQLCRAFSQSKQQLLEITPIVLVQTRKWKGHKKFQFHHHSFLKPPGLLMGWESFMPHVRWLWLAFWESQSNLCGSWLRWGGPCLNDTAKHNKATQVAQNSQYQYQYFATTCLDDIAKHNKATQVAQNSPNTWTDRRGELPFSGQKHAHATSWLGMEGGRRSFVG